MQYMTLPNANSVWLDLSESTPKQKKCGKNCEHKNRSCKKEFLTQIVFVVIFYYIHSFISGAHAASECGDTMEHASEVGHIVYYSEDFKLFMPYNTEM